MAQKKQEMNWSKEHEREIAKRYEATTQGEWVVGGIDATDHVLIMVDPGCTHPEYAEPPQYEPICEVRRDVDGKVPNVGNLNFIANAHQDLPDALAEIKRLRKGLRETKGKLAQTRANYRHLSERHYTTLGRAIPKEDDTNG